MASVAGYCAVAVEIVLIDRHHHLHHLAGGLLGLLVILIEMVFDVAESAFDTKRGGYELHCRNQLISRNHFQYLDVLVRLFRSFLGVGLCCAGPRCGSRVWHQEEAGQAGTDDGRESIIQVPFAPIGFGNFGQFSRGEGVACLCSRPGFEQNP